MRSASDETVLKSRRSFLAAGAGGATVSLLAGCLGGGGSDMLTVGGLQPYSGAFADFASAYEAGITYAFDEANSDGGVLGQDIEFKGRDTETNPSEAASVARRLVERDNAVALAGPVSSDVAMTAAEALEEMEVPLFLHAAGTHEVLSKDSRYTYRVGHLPAPSVVQAQADIVEQEGYETIGAIVGDYAWGRSVETCLEEFFPDSADLTIEVAPFSEGEFTPYLREMPDDVEFIVGSGHPPGVHNMFTQARSIGLDPDLFTAGLQNPSASYDAVGDAITDGFAFFHQPDHTMEQYAEVANRFYEDNGDYFGPTTALGYVTGELIVTGIEEADSDDPVDVSDAIRNIELDTLFPEPIQYTDWGELDGQRQIYSGFETGSPDYYPDGEFQLTERARSSVLEPYDPDELSLE